MFFKDGFMTPCDVSLRLLMDWEDSHPEEDYDSEMSYTLFWDFAAGVDHFFLMDQSGAIIKASPTILGRIEGESKECASFDLDTGILGVFPRHQTGKGLVKAYRLWKTSISARYIFGKFFGMAVLFSDEQVDRFLRDVHSHEGKPTSATEIAKSIVDGFDQGKVRSKADVQEYRELLGPRKFMRVWEMAVAKRPDLSRPGRRGRQDAQLS